MSNEGNGAAAIAREIQNGLRWSQKYRWGWSIATHGSACAVVVFSAIAAVLAQSDYVLLWPLKNWATGLSVLVTIIATIQMKLGFERKWASFRIAHTALRFLDLDRLMGVPLPEIRSRLQGIYQAHDQAVIGGTPIEVSNEQPIVDNAAKARA